MHCDEMTRHAVVICLKLMYMNMHVLYMWQATPQFAYQYL